MTSCEKDITHFGSSPVGDLRVSFLRTIGQRGRALQLGVRLAGKQIENEATGLVDELMAEAPHCLSWENMKELTGKLLGIEFNKRIIFEINQFYDQIGLRRKWTEVCPVASEKHAQLLLWGIKRELVPLSLESQVSSDWNLVPEEDVGFGLLKTRCIGKGKVFLLDRRK